ncbi:MAG TPA: acetyl-CoA C-acyltransferase [Actinomycetota bacterium]|nr:acetyl-CoA C-acyltransferase [Actinomycetota bacterium]
MPEAVIVAAGRTPIGRAKKGSLVDVRPDDMLAYVMRTVVERSGADPRQIADTYVGCGFPNGEQGMNVARVSVLLSGLPETVPATTVNRFCASSLQAIRMGYHAIRNGEGDVFLCGGVESITRVDNLPGGFEALNPEFVSEKPPWNVYLPMGMTAENVADRYDVSRDDMDEFAQRSQERAVAAQKNGFFEREIIPYPKPDGTTVDVDDGPRPDSTLERLRSLQPVFKPDGGKVTAGNACPLNDGAAAVVLMSEEKARAEGIKPLARIVASSVSALDPAIMGVGPIEACRTVLQRAGMTLDDIDIMELNEAFAAQVLPVCRELGMDPYSERFNPHGGAIALGHPYGMTGARIMCTLLNGLQSQDKTIGLETMCVGGGQGMAMIVERMS